MGRLNTTYIILIFAILHAIAVLVCRSIGIDDSIVLTVLTMALTVIICVRERLNIEFTAVNVILVNIVGYVLGITFARLIRMLVPSEIISSAIATFITTGVIGFSLTWISDLFPGVQGNEDYKGIQESQIKWIAMSVGVILFIRIIIDGVLMTEFFEGRSLFDAMSAFLSNSVVLLILVAVTVLFIQYINRERERFSNVDTFVAFVIFFLLTASISALMVGYGFPLNISDGFTFRRFVELAIIGTICEAAIYAVAYIVNYAITARREMVGARMKANIAQARYQHLKQQVNPHFLFNSLNMLDYLVEEDKGSEAREYIRKLAGIYRYMLNKEMEPVVRLSEEMEYVKMYSDLLSLRFQKGLQIIFGIREEDLEKYVVTYSVQMLLENATKHNAISADKPLVVKLLSDGEYLTVSNNINPKQTSSESTGVGLKYIESSYYHKSGKGILISAGDNFYRVKMPLL